MEMLAGWLEESIWSFASMFPGDTFWGLAFNLRYLLAIFILCLISGTIGSLVVGNRMAFFSDALAHCAFAGVAIGLLTSILFQALQGVAFDRWGIPLIMIAFGIGVGLAIAYVREKTALASDTVIGVFFAGA